MGDVEECHAGADTTDRVQPSEQVRAVAESAGATDWLDSVPDLVRSVADEWEIAVGEPFPNSTESFVVSVTTAEGEAAVLKLLMPRFDGAFHHEITALRLADGRGCVRLLRHDVDRAALLLERLGPSLAHLDVPIDRRHEILCETGRRLWRAAPDCGLPTGAWKAIWLAEHIERWWNELDRPCSEGTIEHALACAERRRAAHDEERARLVHGDLHQWNTLQAADGGFRLVDPDGLLAEPEYDLGIVMREDAAELMTGDPRRRSHRLAALSGLDEVAVWEWGVVERVSTGLLGVQDGFPEGPVMLAAADAIAAAR